MKTKILVLPVSRAFEGAQAHYALVMLRTRLDHHDLVELALGHWGTFSSYGVDGDYEQTRDLLITVAQASWRGRRLTPTEVEMVSYALHNLMGRFTRNLEDLLEIAKQHLGVREITSMRPRTYASATHLIVELVEYVNEQPDVPTQYIAASADRSNGLPGFSDRRPTHSQQQAPAAIQYRPLRFDHDLYLRLVPVF